MCFEIEERCVEEVVGIEDTDEVDDETEEKDEEDVLECEEYLGASSAVDSSASSTNDVVACA